ncbi:MAG: TlpA disulfide reductase family protein [Fimbriimonas sp.]|nr:TlpA disulfide reductase family protein [Fimbriimonas sp.]
MLYKTSILIASIVLTAPAVCASAQTGDNTFPLLSGKTVPLTLQLKELDASWRVFTAASSSYENILASAMGGGSNRVYTKGETITVGAEVFLVTYKPDGPDMASLLTSGGPPKAKPISANTTIRLSLLNLHAVTAMDGIKVFDLNEQIGAIPATPLIPRKTEPAASDVVKTAEPVLLHAGTLAPDFTVKDDSGAPVKLSSYRGKVVVIDFWSTWCGPCQESLPSTNSVAAKYAGKGVVVIGVNVWDTQKAFHSWLPDHKKFNSIKFAIDTRGNGQDVATKLYHVSGIPTQYVIDRKGRIVKSLVGYSGSEDDLTSGIKLALNHK